MRKKLKELKSEDKGAEEIRSDKVSKEDKEELKKDRATVEEARHVEIPSTEMPVEVEKEEEIELIAFKISSEEYAVRLLEMQEIINYRKVTPVPRSPAYLKGVTFLRGKVLPVIDLKARLELRGNGDERGKIIVLSTSKNEPVGVIVSSFIRVLRFPEKDILQPPATLNEKEKRFIKGVLRNRDRFISVLNVEELIKMEAV